MDEFTDEEKTLLRELLTHYLDTIRKVIILSQDEVEEKLEVIQMIVNKLE